MSRFDLAAGQSKIALFQRWNEVCQSERAAERKEVAAAGGEVCGGGNGFTARWGEAAASFGWGEIAVGRLRVASAMVTGEWFGTLIGVSEVVAPLSAALILAARGFPPSGHLPAGLVTGFRLASKGFLPIIRACSTSN